MASGPTQNYDDPTLVSWRPRPALARALRVALAAFPVAVAAAAGLLAVRFLPPERVGLHPWLWLAVEVAACAVLLLLVGRVTRRLLPLTTLLRLTLVLPDRVPNRAAAVRRTYSPEGLRARLEQASGDGPEPDATLLLELVTALGRHDRATFRHSERVQGYSALIGRELGLSAGDVARLGWAALLHDVGKLTVPVDVLNKPARPDPAEWAAISGHAAAGGELAAPLARWLGPWAAAIDEHHERWDGAGYPRGLAGEQISLGARIVSVADAYDVITSARAYKAALPADAARAELARCAGEQFDPAVVRAFLAVGLGELRRVAGPFALAGALPAVPLVQHGAARTLGRASGAGSGASATAAAVPGVAAAVVVGAGLAVATPVLSVPAVPDAASSTVLTDVPGGEAGAPSDADDTGVAADDQSAPAGEDPTLEGLEVPDAGLDAGPGAAVPGEDGGPDATGPTDAPADDPSASDDAGSSAVDDPSATPTAQPAGPDASDPLLPPTASDAANEAVGSTGTRPPSSGLPAEPAGRPTAE